MSELKYKEGDKVRIKSLDWYNRHAKETEVNWQYFPFSCSMTKYCGQIMTISIVRGCSYSMIEDDYKYAWTDEMIENLVERNGKTYPYKIGDRVVLKGNNRCATITDLKYNSWGNLSYYVKIDNDKDISIDYPTDLLLPYDNKIKGGLLEEETKPKFKVGDKITNGNVTLTILSLLSDRYVVEDTFGKCGTLYFNSQDEWKIVGEETKPKNEDEKNGETKPKYEDEVNGEYYSTPKYLVRPSGYQFVDENGNVINAQKIVLEKKKRWYPKSYYECCRVLNYEPDEYDKDEILIYGYMADELRSLQKLLVCRNAYWKLYGEEMGLGKPWEPDWSTEYERKYVIEVYRNNVRTNSQGYSNTKLAFPTPEMRDSFKNNFDPDIEFCKELL